MSYSTEKEWFASPTGQLATKFISENPGCTFTCSSHHNNPNFKIWSPSRYEHLDKWCNYIYTITVDEVKTYNDSIPEQLKKLVAPIDVNFHRDYVLPCDITTQQLHAYSSSVKASSLSAFYECVIECTRNHKFAFQQKKDEIEVEERIKRQKVAEDLRVNREEKRIAHEKYKTSIIASFNSVITYTFTTDEIEALCYIYAPIYVPKKTATSTTKIPLADTTKIPLADTTKIFKKNTLLAMQALNRFARDTEIRVEDAKEVIADIWTFK